MAGVSRYCCWKPSSKSPSDLRDQTHNTANDMSGVARMSIERRHEWVASFATRDASAIREPQRHSTSTGDRDSWNGDFMAQIPSEVKASTHQLILELLFYDTSGHDSW
eukprot:CAMPEP_0114243222 /NCGR_PEP_ID=MMETSP0058-20121206/10665_1 /TAXON_ID=36894 /ORGANISM="Pyramimonas parkeae, CCMP726" /LENGTH=107 /DNA_ID=CAMNT_0001356029 /DNA_START=1 /DNA_END=321 /DNA_ORIENTATION=+